MKMLLMLFVVMPPLHDAMEVTLCSMTLTSHAVTRRSSVLGLARGVPWTTRRMHICLWR